MEQLILEVEAGQLTAELARRGVAADARLHVVVEFMDNGSPPMSAIAQAGGAFDWLAEEPDLYTDKDILTPAD